MGRQRSEIAKIKVKTVSYAYAANIRKRSKFSSFFFKVFTYRFTLGLLYTHDNKICRTPRTRAEIIAHLKLASGQYALDHYPAPLLISGAIRMTIPECPRSRAQKFVINYPPCMPSCQQPYCA